METNDFFARENDCSLRFCEAGSCFHICSQENLPVTFHNEDEFITAMNVMALVAYQFPDVLIYTFEIMSNHFHIGASGKKDRIKCFADAFVSRLASHPELRESRSVILKMTPKIHQISDLESLRNVIAYINRNGSVVNPDENVFTYRWGANRYFFNREARIRYIESGHVAGQVEKRKLTRSHALDTEKRIVVLDGYISPLCYCKISDAEGFFRNSRQYFYKVSKNVESQKEIAKIIGESVFYTDEDLISLVISTCARKYNISRPAELPASAKIELAKTLHFDYNATNKQISRLLKMSLETVSSLFPG